jgi:hypothetical protein
MAVGIQFRLRSFLEPSCAQELAETFLNGERASRSTTTFTQSSYRLVKKCKLLPRSLCPFAFLRNP